MHFLRKFLMDFGVNRKLQFCLIFLARFLDWKELCQKSQFVSPDREVTKRMYSTEPIHAKFGIPWGVF
jgi:hypothetical protein